MRTIVLLYDIRSKKLKNWKTNFAWVYFKQNPLCCHEKKIARTKSTGCMEQIYKICLLPKNIVCSLRKYFEDYRNKNKLCNT